MDEPREKTAIVAGANRGIGAAVAAELARLEVCVVLATRSRSANEARASEIRELGGTAEAVTCDVSRYSNVAAVIDRCRGRVRTSRHPGRRRGHPRAGRADCRVRP